MSKEVHFRKKKKHRGTEKNIEVEVLSIYNNFSEVIVDRKLKKKK